MKFSVPTNWQEGLIPNIRKEEVIELYGKLARDYVGGGRSSATIPHPSKRKARLHIKEAHNNNLKFNYLLNATCLDNSEFTRKGQKKLHKLLDWLTDLKVDSITVSIPYLLEIIKKQYPHFEVNVSTQVGVDTVQRAKYWEDLGADKITLSVLDVNRNFNLLNTIRKSVKCKLQLIANLHCLYSCPFYKYHADINSHASQGSHKSKGFFVDYCLIRCSYMRLKDPVEFIRSGWIRPEDIRYYENIGIDTIKFVNRGMDTNSISKIVAAYTSRSYEGNLLDLFPEPSKNIMGQKLDVFHSFMYFFRPFSINLFKLLKKREVILSKNNFYIDNKSLNGFIEYFLKENCREKSCQECRYCDEVSKKVIKFDVTAKNSIEKEFKYYLEELNSSSIFNW